MMRWDPNFGQLGFRELYTRYHTKDWIRVTSILFCIRSPRIGTEKSLPICILVEKRGSISEAALDEEIALDFVTTTEETINPNQMIRRRSVYNEDIVDLFKTWNKESFTQPDRWIVNLRKKLVDTKVLSHLEYTRLTALIEPFLPSHPLNRYRG